MRHIIIWIFICFSSGLIAGNFLKLGFMPAVSLAIICLISGKIFSRKFKAGFFLISVLLFFFFLGILWIKPYTVNLSQKWLGQEVTVCGKVATHPKQAHNYKLYSIRQNHISYNKKTVYLPNDILVKDYSHTKINFADSYVFKGKIRDSSYSRYGYILYVKKQNQPFGIKSSFNISKWAFAISENIAGIFKNNFKKPVSAFFLTVFLGRREYLSSRITDIFRLGGTSHVLAISGLHVGIVAAIFLFLLKMFNIRIRIRLIIAMIVILIYAVICELRSPVLRAAVMFICYGMSFLLNRKFLVFNALASAGLINLLVRPYDIFTVSFQFSFIAVLFIITGFRFFNLNAKLAGFRGKIGALFFMSLFANLGLLPLVSYYFGKVYLLNIFTSILVIPYLALIFASMFVFLGLYFAPALKQMLVTSCSVLVQLFIKMNDLFSGFNLSYIEFKFSFAGIFVYYSTFFIGIYLARFVFSFYRRRTAKHASLGLKTVKKNPRSQ